MIKAICAACILITGTCQALSALEKIYIDSHGLVSDEDAFHIHVGNNTWLETSCVRMDASGLYTFEYEIVRDENRIEYVKKWKCPYCNMYWPVRTACQNPECPSRY